MTLEDGGDLATVAALLILVYVTAKPTLNRWAAVKFLRTYYEAPIEDFLTSDPPEGLPRKVRVARSTRRIFRRFYHQLMTKVDRINHIKLHQAFQAAAQGPDEMLALKAPYPSHDLTQRERELVIEAVALSRARQKRLRRRLPGSHKDAA